MDHTPKLRRAIGMGLFTGAATLIPLWRIPRKPLLLWTGGLVAVAAAGGTILSMDQVRREEEIQGTAGPAKPLVRRIAAPAGIGLAAGGFAAGAMWVNTVTDRWVEGMLAKLGASRPRATYAVLAGVLTAVAEYADPQHRPSAPEGEKA